MTTGLELGGLQVGLLVVRLVVGLTLAAHGAQKLFGWFGGPGLKGAGAMMESLGLRPGRLQAFLAGLTETAGGLLLAVGLFTPLAATVVISVMIVAAVTVHLRNGFFLQKGGIEYTVVLASGGLALAFTGPGAWSLDNLLGIAYSGATVGLAALALAVIGATGLLLTRSTPAASHS